MIEQPAYTGFGFSDEEWGLLVGLPQSVLTAASAAESDGTRRTMAENAAGLETIAAGRESASPLVAAVAGEIVTRVGDPEAGEELPVIAPADPQALHRRRAGPGRARPPRCWPPGSTRARPARTGTGWWRSPSRWWAPRPAAGSSASAATSVSDSERRFRDRLSHVLND